MTLLSVYYHKKWGLVRTGHRYSILSKISKWHSDRFDRPRKLFGNNILQIYWSFEKIYIKNCHCKKCSGVAKLLTLCIYSESK